MSGFFSLRRLLTAAILVSAVTGVSTLLAQTVPSTSGPAIPPPGTMPAPGDPIAIINGRLSDRSFRRYRRLRPFARWLSFTSSASVAFPNAVVTMP